MQPERVISVQIYWVSIRAGLCWNVDTKLKCLTCQGYSPTSVWLPPTILVLVSARFGIPQSEGEKYISKICLRHGTDDLQQLPTSFRGWTLIGGEFPGRPGQEGSVQYSQPSEEVTHQGSNPSIEVHLSCCLPYSMKGKTQFPQVWETVEGAQRRDISDCDITECDCLGVFILPTAVHVSLAGSYLRISSRLSPLYPPFNNRFSLRGKLTNLTKHKHWISNCCCWKVKASRRQRGGIGPSWLCVDLSGR